MGHHDMSIQWILVKCPHNLYCSWCTLLNLKSAMGIPGWVPWGSQGGPSGPAGQLRPQCSHGGSMRSPERSTVTFAFATSSACTVVMFLIPWHRKAVFDFATIRCVSWHTRFPKEIDFACIPTESGSTELLCLFSRNRLWDLVVLQLIHLVVV